MNALSHSVDNPVGQVAAATHHRTPPVAYPTGNGRRESVSHSPVYQLQPHEAS
jgi:hypothetical protein